jgi:hypothetical protein
MGFDFLAGFILYFFNDTFLAPFIIFGFYYLDQKIILKASILMVFTMVINAYLKQVWQIPLNPEIFKSGWAYPSGHTSSNVVFWGAIALQYNKKKLYLIFSTILTFGFISMEYVGYHDWIDIFGGICLGLSILTISYPYLSKIPIYVLASGLQIICMFVLFFMIDHQLKNYHWLWLSQGMLTGVIICEYFKLIKKAPQNKVLINIILAFLGIYLIALAINYFKLDSLGEFIKGWLIAFWAITLVPHITSKLLRI